MTLLLLVLTLVVQSVAPQEPPAGNRGEIRGRVVDAETGQPLSRAHVNLAARAIGFYSTVATDDSGRFAFTGLAAGRYDGIVDPGPNRGTHLYQSLPQSRDGPRFIDLAAGEVRELQVALVRGRVVEIRVVDEFGDPLAQVRVTGRHAVSGDAVPLPFLRTTNDLGVIRVFGLPPGKYLFCAEASSLGRQSAPGSTPLREKLLRTCHPSASDETEAEPVTVGTSDPPTVDIRMRRGRTFTVAGRVIDATGAPAGDAFVGLHVYVAGGSSGSAGKASDDGTFRIAGVHPGTYGLHASIGGPDRPGTRRPAESALIPIRVDGDLENMTVALKTDLTVNGRVTIEDTAASLPQAPGSGLLMVSTRLGGERLPGSGSKKGALVGSDRTFTLTGIFGPRVIGVDNVPRGWYVKAIRYGTRDVIDREVDFATVPSASLDVVLSDRGAVITGRVVDNRGEPVPRARVLAFRADSLHPGSAIDASTTASGTFSLGPMRAGDYSVVALIAPATLGNDWQATATLASQGERVTLSPFEERALELRLKPGPQDK